MVLHCIPRVVGFKTVQKSLCAYRASVRPSYIIRYLRGDSLGPRLNFSKIEASPALLSSTTTTAAAPQSTRNNNKNNDSAFGNPYSKHNKRFQDELYPNKRGP
jgi:hypothetical protein